MSTLRSQKQVKLCVYCAAPAAGGASVVAAATVNAAEGMGWSGQPVTRDAKAMLETLLYGPQAAAYSGSSAVYQPFAVLRSPSKESAVLSERARVAH